MWVRRMLITRCGLLQSPILALNLGGWSGNAEWTGDRF